MKGGEKRCGAALLNTMRRRSMAALCLLLVVQIILVVALPAFAAGGDVILVTSSAPKVYSGAGTGYSSIGSAAGGTEYTFLSQTKGTDGAQWYEIQYSGSKTGWISSKSGVRLSAEESRDPQNGVRAIAEAYGAVGVQAATIENGVVSRSCYSGWAVKGGRVMAADTKIRVASLSKVIIAMTALKMQEDGIVDLDARIDTYWDAKLPKAVTLRNLLTHTSTLRDLTPGSGASGVLTQLKSSSSYTTGTPGSSSVWYYNNYGAAIAGTTLEMAAGKNIDSYADSRLFDSLGIDAAWMSGRVNTSKLATLYRNDGSVARAASTSATLVGSDTPGANTAYYAGGFTTSAADYAKLIAILANDGTYGGVRYLSADSVAQMEKPFFTCNSGKSNSFQQCLALRYKDGLYGQSGLYYHTGNAYGMLSLASYNPSTGNGVVVVTTACTQGTDSQGIYSVCSAISRYLYNFMERQPGKPATAVEIDKTVLEMHKGDKKRLAAVLTPADSDSTVMWSSSRPNCVSVASDGTVTAKGHGSAVITAEANGITARCTITVLPPDVDITMMGATVRVTEPFGLRFVTKLMKDAELASADIVEYGTLIMGSSVLGDAELTVETPNVRRVPAVNIYDETDEYIMYTGVIINIPESGFDIDLTGRGYLIYRNADGTEEEIYTDPASMSFGYAASATYDVYAGMDKLTDAQRSSMEKLRDILGIEEETEEPQTGVVTGSDVSSSDGQQEQTNAAANTLNDAESSAVSGSDAAEPAENNSQEEPEQ